MKVNVLLVLLALPIYVGADVPDTQKPEVNYLIKALEISDCEMVRNGKAYGGATGAKHVRRKYNHFKDDISSTEEFIELSASKSTKSGEDYWITCSGHESIRSRDWMLQQLQAFRAQ